MKKKAIKNVPENVNKVACLNNAADNGSNMEHHISDTNVYTGEETITSIVSCLYEIFIDKQQDYEN